MSALRVLIPALSAKSYGGDSYFRSILPVLSRRRDVEVVVVAPDERFAACVPAGGAVALRTVRVPGLFRGPARVAWEQSALPRLAREHGASVVFTANNSGLLGGGVPCVIAVRNMEPLTPPWPGTPACLRARHALLARFTGASARAAARVVAASGFVRDAVLGLGVPASRIDVVYHGVDDLPRPEPGAPRSGGFMAAAAKFVRYANLETMLRAFARVRGRGYRGVLRMAGGPHDAGYEREIRALTADLGLGGAVEFLGYRPREEVRALMRDCDAFLFPSMLEACPFTLLEALSQGAAVVATTAPPMPEFAGDGAALVPPRDPEAFAEAAWRAATDAAYAAGLRERAARRADAFTWDAAVNGLVACWRAACVS
ncbi:MAG: glycosyltransferase [Elusimicrobia bacterium]|nr:glycosyltransferase [Elusimicrobiota bacterium]